MVMGAVVDESESGEQLPRWFGDYVLLKRLGKGGMGQVFLARLPGLAGIDRLCVIKTLRSQWTADREYVARFVDEARVVVHLNHRNICPVFDVGQVRSTYYLAMDLVPGRDLQALWSRITARGGGLDVDVALFVVGEVLEALDAAHRARHPDDDSPLQLVHRDVSPHNVLVSFDGEVKLIDFGLAQSALKREQTEPGVVLGKMAYMAPEHARGEPVDRRADVFAVGVMLYELLTGERYWHGLTMQDIWQVVGRGTHHPRRLDELAESMPAIGDVIRRATAAHPAERFPTAAAMRQAIVKAQITRGVVAGSAELRDAIDSLFPGEAVADRRERAALARLPAPDVDDPHGSTRIASAPALPAAPAAPRHNPDEGPTLSDAHKTESDAGPLERTETSQAAPPPPPSPDEPSTVIVARRRPAPAELAPPTPAPAPPPRSRRPLVGVAVASAIVTLVAVIGWRHLHDQPPAPVLTAPPVTALPTPVAAPAPTSPTPPPPTPPPPTTTTTTTAPIPPLPPVPAPIALKPKPPAPTPPPPAEPWPTSLPRPLPERIELLRRRCASLPCAKRVLQDHLRFDVMEGDEPFQHADRVKACLETCRSP
jgi:eukaryotic-like serine/threonine-protein kinase